MTVIPEVIRDLKYLRPYEQERCRIIETLIPRGKGLAVDIGCGSGYFTRTVRDRGWHVTGVDAEPGNCRLAGRYAHKVLCGDAVACLSQLEPSSVDFAIALEIIEHLDETEEFLGALHRVVKPRARLLISTPNRYSLEGLYGHYWGEKLCRGKKWTAWDDNHVRVFSSLEFLGLLRRCGWRPEKVVGYHYKGRVSLPIKRSYRWPLNLFGFNTIVLCAPPMTNHAGRPLKARHLGGSDRVREKLQVEAREAIALTNGDALRESRAASGDSVSA
jgi:2-polyprenyl-3-methyl-5-hydroxy-6-metoxy-1,4-benzoquinol methylase